LRFVLLAVAIMLTQRFLQNGLIAPVVFAGLQLVRRRRKRATGPKPDMARVAEADLPEASRHSLRAVGLTRRFGGVVAVNGLSFSVARGELIGLIGPNGSGKTTLINLLTGTLRPNAGTVEVDGRDMRGRAPHEFARHGIGRTFQVPRLFLRMTVRENLTVPALAASTVSGRELERRLEEMLVFFNLADLADEPARALSGGQRKLLELGRVLMLNPSILYLDEPFAGVHPRLLDQIVERIERLNARGYTIILVDHNLDAVRRIAEKRLMVMARGELIADGPPSEVLKHPAVVTAYLGG
jgi:branched-chain amino acid transport system ATP-binding protein